MILSLTSLEPMTDSCNDNTIIAPLQAGHTKSNCISSRFSPFCSSTLALYLQLGPSELLFFDYWWLGSINTEKHIKATRANHVTLQFLPLIIFFCNGHTQFQ
jgi:hypothetical protein